MVSQQLRDFVRERAKDQCEYCQLPHELEPFLPFTSITLLPNSTAVTTIQ
jgi:hypothetical protein